MGLVVIPKSVTESRILENLKATEITLMPEDIETLERIDKNFRLITFKPFMTSCSGLTVDTFWDTFEDKAFKV